MYGADVRTGETVVDAVVQAVMRRDAGALDQLVVLDQVPCKAPAPGLDPPPECPPGAVDGTPVAAVRGGACHGYWIPAANVRAALEDFVDGGPPLFLFAVTRSAPARDAFGRAYGAVAYGLVFAPAPAGERARALFVAKSGIIDIWRGCSADARESVEGARDFLLAPKQ